MKIIKNEKLIIRNGKIGQYVSLASLIVLGVGMYISFANPEYFFYSLVCLMLGFVMTQVGIYMGSRWGRSPRADEKLDTSLKGLHSDFNIYHYASPVSHLLVGPSGVWILHTYHQSGKVAYEKDRWRLSGGGFMQGYMRIFGQEGLGRPDMDAQGEAQTLKKFFAKKMDAAEIPEVKSILIFTNDDIELNVGDSPIPALRIKQLKEFLRQGAKNRALSSIQIEKIAGLFNTP